MSSPIFGSNAFIEIKMPDGLYKAIGCAISCSIDFTNEMIGKTDRNAGLFRKRRVRLSDSACNITGLTTLENDDNTVSIMYMLQEGIRRTEQDLRISLTDQQGTAKQIQGVFIVESINITGDSSSFSEFDLSMVGSGGLAITAIDPGNEGIPGDVIFDWWATTPGSNTITGPGHYGRSFAGHDIIEVDREGQQYDLDDTPETREYSTDGTTITFDPNNPFNPGERVFVIWQIDAP